MESNNNTKKMSIRQFACRTTLWDDFIRLAKEAGCSVDHLINESMSRYLRQEGYLPQPAAQPAAAARPTRHDPPQPPPLPPPRPRAAPPKLPVASQRQQVRVFPYWYSLSCPKK